LVSTVAETDISWIVRDCSDEVISSQETLTSRADRSSIRTSTYCTSTGR
jgi:hypothetical protein